MQNCRICLTFDYELFFGDISGTVDKCILTPTGLLLDTFEERKIKGTFFIDVLFFQRLLERKDSSRHIGLIREQVQRIVSLGSSIGLHLHPHWVNAVFEGPSWRFPSYKSYCLESFPSSQIEEMFVQGTSLLNEIAREAVKGYTCRTFRAGGFALPPFHMIADAFRKNGIHIDSSIASRLHVEHADYTVDFPVVRKGCYHFESDPLTETPGGAFTEVPISTREISVLQKIVKRLSGPAEEPPIFGDGIGMTYRNRWKRRLRASSKLLSLDRGGQEYARAAALAGKDLWTFISHPKAMNVASIDILRELHDSGFQFVNLEEACLGDY